MTVDNKLQAHFTDVSEARSEIRSLAAILQRSSGGGTSDGMDSRVTKLETHMEYVRKDLDDIKVSLRKLDDLPTRRDLDSWRWQWMATGIAILALTVGGITGGLALIARFAG